MLGRRRDCIIIKGLYRIREKTLEKAAKIHEKMVDRSLQKGIKISIVMYKTVEF